MDVSNATATKEHRLPAFEDWILRKTYEPKRKRVIKGRETCLVRWTRYVAGMGEMRHMMQIIYLYIVVRMRCEHTNWNYVYHQTTGGSVM